MQILQKNNYKLKGKEIRNITKEAEEKENPSNKTTRTKTNVRYIERSGVVLPIPTEQGIDNYSLIPPTPMPGSENEDNSHFFLRAPNESDP